jgi:hypothetical protein
MCLPILSGGVAETNRGLSVGIPMRQDREQSSHTREERTGMRLRKKHTLRDTAADLVEHVRPTVESAVESAKDTAGPLLEDARELLEEAREKAGPAIAEAREKAGPAIAEAREHAAAAVAPAAVTGDSGHKRGGRLKKLLLLGGLVAVAGLVFKKLRGNVDDANWQSTYAPTPPPAPSSTTPTAAAAAADEEAPEPEDAAASSPDEALADSAAAAEPHEDTTPDAPAEVVDLPVDTPAEESPAEEPPTDEKG